MITNEESIDPRQKSDVEYQIVSDNYELQNVIIKTLQQKSPLSLQDLLLQIQIAYTWKFKLTPQDILIRRNIWKLISKGIIKLENDRSLSFVPIDSRDGDI
jgi:hypothetical protein